MHGPAIRHGVARRCAPVLVVHNTEALCCSLKLYLCSNEEAGGCWPWDGDAQRSFYFCLKVTTVFNGSASRHMWSVSPEFLNSSSLCLFKRIVSLSLVFAPPSLSVSFLLVVVHSLALVSAPASPSPEWRRMLERFLSWIMCINRRGQTEWVLWDNDWSDGTWAQPDCGVSELVIKRQGRRTLDARCVL